MIRDRFALFLVAAPIGFLVLLGGLASTGAAQRPLDAITLWLASFLHFGFVVTWVLIARLPKWIAAGWGLILVALGIGVTIAGPVMQSRVPPEPGAPPAVAVTWGLIGLAIVGILTILAAIIHSPSETAS